MMTRQDIATIERIVRQQWLDASDPNERRLRSWIEVDQDQALELIALIPGIPDCGPIKPLPTTCPTCEDIRTNHNGFGPSHDGSKMCESGSIASGGQIAHCSCDTCF